MASEVRAGMVEAAVRLLARNGLEGTSFAEVLASSGAPRGSLYHHFPGGKVELVHAAMDLASERAVAALETTRGLPAGVVVERFVDLWRDLLDRTDLSAGCAVLAVTVAADDTGLLDHAGQIFAFWTELLSGLLSEGGGEEKSVQRLATTVIAAIEGGMAMSRAQHSREPFERVAKSLLLMVD